MNRRPSGSTASSGPGEVVSVPRFQTAKLWSIPNPAGPTSHVVSYHCATCKDPENSRLLQVVLKTAETENQSSSATEHAQRKLRVLLHVTRPEVEEILASFGRKDNGDTLRAICALPEESDTSQMEDR